MDNESKKLYKFPKLGVVGGINLGNARKKASFSYKNIVEVFPKITRFQFWPNLQMYQCMLEWLSSVHGYFPKFDEATSSLFLQFFSSNHQKSSCNLQDCFDFQFTSLLSQTPFPRSEPAPLAGTGHHHAGGEEGVHRRGDEGRCCLHNYKITTRSS